MRSADAKADEPTETARRLVVFVRAGITRATIAGVVVAYYTYDHHRSEGLAL